MDNQTFGFICCNYGIKPLKYTTKQKISKKIQTLLEKICKI